ncbi:helix-turn-helix transcriptional regulator [Roseovarius sp.]|uniref:helix-turn-helix transcriptional regulator n=1 Tax=Roseovarius sp. TaxID=1486281 RepID=UPI003A9845FB
MPQTYKFEPATSQKALDRLIRFSDGLTMLGLSKSTAYRMIKQGALPRPVKIGHLAFFSERELQDWIAEKLAERDAGGCHD